MAALTLSDVLNLHEYELSREDFRRRIIEIKRRRRVALGDLMTVLFESRETVLFQIQEMVRAERLVHDEAIQHEIETYNQLLPEHNELAATMLIELQEAGRIREEITKFYGVNTGDATYLQIGDQRLPGIFATGQSDDRRISAVQYVRFRLSDQQREALVRGEQEVRLVIDHPNYRHSTAIEGEVRQELARDFGAI